MMIDRPFVCNPFFRDFQYISVLAPLEYQSVFPKIRSQNSQYRLFTYSVHSQKEAFIDHAALVEFNESTMLTEDEYKLLKCALQLARSEEKEARAMGDALQGYVEDATPKLKALPLFFTLSHGRSRQALR
jgi:hypothetical protein